MNKNFKIILIISLLLNLSSIYIAYKALEYRSHINYYMDKYMYVLDEMGQTNYFRDGNQPLKSDSTVANRLVFFGTQVINEWDVKAEFPQYEAINRGVPSQRFGGLLLRFQQDVVQLGPEIVVVELASYNFRAYHHINDIKNFYRDITAISKYNNIEPIFISVIPPTDEYEPGEADLELGEYNVCDSVKMFNYWLLEFGQSNNLKIVDIQRTISDKNGYLDKTYSKNIVELNNQGYDILKSKLLETIEAVKKNQKLE